MHEMGNAEIEQSGSGARKTGPQEWGNGGKNKERIQDAWGYERGAGRGAEVRSSGEHSLL
eukprot:CAMPEP_0206590148 /NCGR_PEP_ID=MMETSP0325_2-20121206/39407_1 /ASSEMBLY_ACC=CAM_ASM_000347 /TAXON_ID=2866 /ORGANISM="Crypthecodinium cohnii, Strain Seligo" /LENGTH=59 /DNA_ID=CAMNT_0054098965 /DNA_START=435 /DNA_END=611 /DNA_ORIENTATION=-